jgi:hypothetical protein
LANAAGAIGAGWYLWTEHPATVQKNAKVVSKERHLIRCSQMIMKVASIETVDIQPSEGPLFLIFSGSATEPEITRTIPLPSGQIGAKANLA